MDDAEKAKQIAELRRRIRVKIEQARRMTCINTVERIMREIKELKVKLGKLKAGK